MDENGAVADLAERVMTRGELYARVWGRGYRKSDRSVDVYVGRLRAKLGPGRGPPDSHPFYIGATAP